MKGRLHRRIARCLRVLFGYFTGGVGRFVERVGRFGVNVATDPCGYSQKGIEVDTFVRRVFGSVSSEKTQRHTSRAEKILTWRLPT